MASFVFVVRESPAGKLGIGLGIDPQQGRIVITHVAGDGHVGRNVHSEDAVAEGDQLVGVGGTVFKVLHEGAVVEHGARMGAGELRVALPALGRADVLGGKSDAQLVALFGGTPVDEIAVRTKLTEVELDRAFELLKTSTRPFKLSLHRDRKEDFALEGMWMRARIARVGARWRRVWVAVEAHRLPVLVAVFYKKQWPAPAAEDATAIDAFRKRVRANAAQHAELGNVCAAADSGAGDSDITVLKAGAAPLLGRRGRRKRRLSLVEDTTRLLLRASCAEERARWLREVHAAQVRNERHALAERALISTKRADETRRRYNLRKAVVAQSLSMFVETSAGSVGRAALAAAAPPIDAAAAVEAVSLVATALSAARVAAAASADAAEAMKEMGDHVEDTLVRVAREDALARGGVWVQCKRGGRFAKRWCVLDAGYAPGDPPRTPALVGLFVHADIAASIHHALRVGDLVLIHGRRSVGSYDGRYGVVVSVGSGTAGMKRRQTDDGVYPDDAPAIEVDVRQDGTYDAPAGGVSLSGVDVWRVLRPSDASRAFRALEGGQFDEEAAVVRRAATRAVAAHALAVARVEAKSDTTTDVHLTVDGAAVEGLAADKDDVEEVWTLRFKSRAERDAWLAGVGRALTRLRRVMSEGRLLTVPNRRRLELRRALVLASVVHGVGRRSDATIAAFASEHATTNDVALLSLTTATDLAVHNARSASRVAELCSESASREVERTAALSTAKTSSAGSSSGTVADSADAWQLQGVVAPPVPAHTDHRQRSSSASWSRNGSGDAHGEFDDATTAAVERRANELTVMDAAHMTAAKMAASSAKARASASAVSAALAARRAAHFARIAVGASRTSVRVLLNTLAVRLCAIASCAAAAAAASATLAEHIGVRSAEAERARSRKVRTVGASRAMAAGITALIAAKGSARSAKISERGVRDIGQRALGARIAPVRDAAAHAARRAATSAAHSTAEADASIVAVTESEALIAALFGSVRETQVRRSFLLFAPFFCSPFLLFAHSSFVLSFFCLDRCRAGAVRGTTLQPRARRARRTCATPLVCECAPPRRARQVSQRRAETKRSKRCSRRGGRRRRVSCIHGKFLRRAPRLGCATRSESA